MVDQWVFRLQWQEKVSYNASFITFTYEDSFLPVTKGGRATLDKKDFTAAIKRLRNYQYKRCPGLPALKYYCVGEYGSEFHRPHYHAIIYNFDQWEVENAWSKNVDLYGGVTKRFPIGNIQFDEVNNNTIAYVLKYLDKGKTVPSDPEDDREPEFTLQSKGLGISYTQNPSIRKWHLSDIERNYVVNKQGKKIPLPRYYRNKIYDGPQQLEQRYYAQIAVENFWLDDREKFFRESGATTESEYFRYLHGIDIVKQKKLQRHVKNRKDLA